MAQQHETCPVCFSKALITPDGNRDCSNIAFPRCGRFSVSRTADTLFRAEMDESETGNPRLGGRDSRRRANASAWMRSEHRSPLFCPPQHACHTPHAWKNDWQQLTLTGNHIPIMIRFTRFVIAQPERCF